MRMGLHDVVMAHRSNPTPMARRSKRSDLPMFRVADDGFDKLTVIVFERADILNKYFRVKPIIKARTYMMTMIPQPKGFNDAVEKIKAQAAA
jgi:hypothetical protein